MPRLYERCMHLNVAEVPKGGSCLLKLLGQLGCTSLSLDQGFQTLCRLQSVVQSLQLSGIELQLENVPDRVLKALDLREIGKATFDALGKLRLLVEQVQGATGFGSRAVAAYNALHSGQSPAGDKLDLKVERASQAHLKEAIGYCESVRDYVSRELLEDILEDTEEHIDHLETQIELVGKVGEQNYLQSQMGHDEPT